MAFPTPSATATGGSASDVTSPHPVNIPAGNQANSLLIAVFVNDGTATVSGWPTGWSVLQASELGGTSVHRWEIRYKISDGTESDFNLTTSAAESSAAITYLIKAWDKATAPAIGTTVKASTASPDPPSLDPANWAAEDTLWLAVQGTDDGRTTASSAPTNYSGLVVARPSSLAAGVIAAAAHRALNAASENPGTFTNSASDPTMANTIAVRPGPDPAAPVITGSASLSGAGTLASSGVRLRQGASALSGSGDLVADGTVPGAWGPPQNLIATAVSASQIDLSWDEVTIASGYDVERDGVVIAQNVAVTTYQDTGLASSTVYTYRVRAVA